MARTILLVGARRPAVEAAVRLGLRPCVLAEQGVTAALRARAARVAEVPFDGDPGALVAAGRAALGGDRAAAVVPVAERAVVPAAVVREALGLPGQSVGDARAARGKDVMKARFVEAGLPCVVPRRVAGEDEALAVAGALGWPVVVKALASSGSRGTVIARDPDAVRAAVRAIEATPGAGGAGLEPFVRGREVSIEAFVAGGRVLSSSPTEYVVPGRVNLLPAPLDPSLRAALEALSARAAAAVGARDGVTHAEFYLTDDGPLIGEIAARPPGGRLMDLIGRAYAFDAWGAFLSLAVDGRPAEPLPRAPRRYVGNVHLHRGPGTVRAIEGWDAVRALPGVVEARLRVAPGDRIDPRVGTGQTVGHVTVEGDDPDAVRATLLAVDQRLRIVLDPP